MPAIPEQLTSIGYSRRPGIKVRSEGPAAGRQMIEEMKRPRVLVGSTECSSCRMQMEEGANKRTLHPVQYLALAYGLLPEVEGRLKEPLRELLLR